MKSSSQLLLNWGSKVMKSDERIINKLGNHWGFLLWNGNVTVLTQNKIQKPQFLLGFFFACHINLQ